MTSNLPAPDAEAQVEKIVDELAQEYIAGYPWFRTEGTQRALEGCKRVIAAALTRERERADAAEKEARISAEIIGDLRRKLAIAGVEGSPPPGGEATIPKLLRQWREERERAEKAEKALRELGHGQETPVISGRRERSCPEWGYDLGLGCPGCAALWSYK